MFVGGGGSDPPSSLTSAHLFQSRESVWGSFTCVFCGHVFALIIKFYTLYNFQNLQLQNCKKKIPHKVKFAHKEVWKICLNSWSANHGRLPIALYPPTGSGPTPQTKRGTHTLQYYKSLYKYYLRGSPQLSIFLNSSNVCPCLPAAWVKVYTNVRSPIHL